MYPPARLGKDLQGSAAVTETSQRVAEDYAPFDVDVTTQDPGAAAINRSSATDLQYGTRVVIDPINWYQPGCGCGGIAYVGVFDTANNGHDQPAMVFTLGYSIYRSTGAFTLRVT